MLLLKQGILSLLLNSYARLSDNAYTYGKILVSLHKAQLLGAHDIYITFFKKYTPKMNHS